MMSSMTLLHTRLKHLERDEKLELKRKSIELAPDFNIVEQTLICKRSAEGDGTKTRSHRADTVYRIKVKASNASYQTILTLDEHGQLKAYTLQQQLGEITYLRTDG
jgi:hypothetical protein